MSAEGTLKENPILYLKELDFGDFETIAPVTGGADTAIWKVEREGEAFALRVFRPEQEPALRRELAALETAALAGIPVPKVVSAGLCGERPAMILVWCPGATLSQALKNAPSDAKRLGEVFGQMQARIHRIPAPPSLHPQREQEPLLHLDYHPNNVLTDGKHITGIIDWTNTRAGDPRADCARTIAILRLAPYGGEIPVKAERAIRRELEAGWRIGYTREGGELTQMAAFYAEAGADMIPEHSSRIGKAGSTATQRDIVRMRHWVGFWKRRAELE